MSSKLQVDVRHLSQWKRHLMNSYEVKTQAWRKVMTVYCPTLGNEYGGTLTFVSASAVRTSKNVQLSPAVNRAFQRGIDDALRYP